MLPAQQIPRIGDSGTAPGPDTWPPPHAPVWQTDMACGWRIHCPTGPGPYSLLYMALIGLPPLRNKVLAVPRLIPLPQVPSTIIPPRHRSQVSDLIFCWCCFVSAFFDTLGLFFC